MMRIFSFLLMVSALVPVYADNWIRDAEPALLEVRYIRTELIDTTKRDIKLATYEEETMLRIGAGMSRYCSVPHFYRDSLMYCAPDLYWQMEQALFEKDPKEFDRTSLSRSGRYWNVIYKNYPKGKVTETSYFDMENWHYEEEWEQPEWEITDESKDIMGYECFKASTDYRGRHWTAWFAPEIPIQDGPWKLCGLPGLILEAGDSNGEYHFMASGIRQQGVPEVGFLCYKEKRGVNKVSRDKFFNNWWKYKHSNFGTKMASMFGNAPKPTLEKKAKNELHHDKEEINYPHDL